jgi:prephenate dehydrogenase
VPFERIAILGVGLLGGSLGLAIKARGLAKHVVGYGHRATTLQTAQRIGAIDSASDDAPTAVAGCDLVVLCTPVGLFESLLKQIAPTLSTETLITDVGSTKRSIVASAERLLPDPEKFVGSHPMAGSEKRGVEFARADLFTNALCITTPTANTNPDALFNIEAFWRELGMRTTRLSPDEHDRLLALVSHLPHAVAAALVAVQNDQSLNLAGKGFLDSTRIAGGDPGLWRDIFLDNRDYLNAAIDLLKVRLTDLQRMLQTGQSQPIADSLEQSVRSREQLVNQKLTELDR